MFVIKKKKCLFPEENVTYFSETRDSKSILGFLYRVFWDLEVGFRGGREREEKKRPRDKVCSYFGSSY